MDRSVNLSILENYNKDSETIDGSHSKVEVIECHMQGPENIKWAVQVNETKIEGVKSTTTGSQLDIVVHIDLKIGIKAEETTAIR